MANIALREDGIAEVKRLRSLALEIRKQNAENSPSNGSSHDLSQSYEKLAIIALSEDNIDEAKRLYFLKLDIDKQNAKSFRHIRADMTCQSAITDWRI